MILSSQVLSSPKCCRMALTCSKASLSLQTKTKEFQEVHFLFTAFYIKREKVHNSFYFFLQQHTDPDSHRLPFYLREELCFKDASGLQSFRNLPSEQEASLGHVYEDVTHNFPEVHAAAHFLISTIKKQKQKQKKGVNHA